MTAKFQHFEFCHLAATGMQQAEPQVASISDDLTYLG